MPKTGKRAMGFSLYGLKPWFTTTLTVFIQAAHRRRLSPDVFTAVGVFGAFLGALVLALPAFSPELQLPWWASALLVFLFGLVVRLGGANLDGAVARARGVSRPAGFILNELGDRASDFLLFLGLYLGTPTEWKFLVLVVALASVLPTLVAVSGSSVGAPRFNGGPFGKTERSLAFVAAGALLPQGLITWQESAYGALLVLMLLGALLTAGKRFRKITRHLAKEGTTWRDEQPTVVKGRDS